ncbi:TPA: hypothetical protein HA231_05470 [Candidatus Woesearchaeota archaeon]|nr:hypothetical protein [Candidatus Woesearchaeota archaeon]
MNIARKKLEIMINAVKFNKGTALISELIPLAFSGLFMPDILSGTVTAPVIISLAVNHALIPITAGIIYESIRGRMEMPSFLIEETRQIKPDSRCTGRTNTGNETVILTSYYYNSGEDADRRREGNKKEARMMNNYLTAKKGFFGYKTGIAHLEDNAQPSDLEEALKDPGVSSIVLIGHSTTGSWMTTSGDVGREDVLRWVDEAGHCKSGFGLKTGCNVIYSKPQDEGQLLTPAYGHRTHPGELAIVKGRPPEPTDYPNLTAVLYNLLPKGPHVEVTRGIELNTRLIKLDAYRK